MAYPATYRYTKEHEWINVAGTTGTVGITDYAQGTLGDIVFVELPKPGTSDRAGQGLRQRGISQGRLSDLYSPVTGTVTEINEELANAPEKINSDAHGAWMLKVTLTDPSEVEQLLNAADYEAFVKEETH